MLIDIEKSRSAENWEKIGNYCIEANKMYKNLVQNLIAPPSDFVQIQVALPLGFVQNQVAPHPYCPPPTPLLENFLNRP